MLRQHVAPDAPALTDDERRRIPVLVAALVLVLLYTFGGASMTPHSSLQASQPSTGEHGELVLEQRVRQYFGAWNSHDPGMLRAHFQETGTLRDWQTSVQGVEGVVEANQAIWAAQPGIAIEIVAIHPSSATHTVACEILVRLNDASGTVLKVTDVIEYGMDQRIASLRAYKG